MAAGLVAGAAPAVADPPSGAGPGNSDNAKRCQKHGWADLVQNDGAPFGNEGQCTRYAATGGTLYTASEGPCLNGGWQELLTQGGFWFGTESHCLAYVQSGGTPLTFLAYCKQEIATAGIADPADANYILGDPRGNTDFTGRATPGNDVFCGFIGFDRLDELTEGDVFVAGSGHNSVGTVAGGTYVGGSHANSADRMTAGTFIAGDLHNALGTLEGGTFHGGDGDDIVGVIDGGTFNGGLGKDRVNGELRSGTFNGGAGDDLVRRLLGGTFNGQAGCDTVEEHLGGVFDQGEPC